MWPAHLPTTRWRWSLVARSTSEPCEGPVHSGALAEHAAPHDVLSQPSPEICNMAPSREYVKVSGCWKSADGLGIGTETSSKMC
eukprot:5919667-Pleurochrysis_carterae.AAC.4